MDDTDKMCVYEGYIKARDCRQETLVKYEAHRYLSTNEWINAAFSNNVNFLFELKGYFLLKIKTIGEQTQIQSLYLNHSIFKINEFVH